jgi:ADP-heptose:LPS heptosyltransferase
MLYFCARKVNLKSDSVTTRDRLSEKILVLFPGALGDFICFLPALEALAGQAEVDLLARTEYEALVPKNVVTRSLERCEISRLFAAGAERDERLKRFFASYASVYSWMGSGQPEFAGRLRTLCPGRLSLYPFRPADARLPMVDYFLECLGIARPEEISLSIPVQAEACAWSEEFWLQRNLRGKKVLGIAPGSGAREKNWPCGFYLEVMSWWNERFVGDSVVLLGPVEEERGPTGAPREGIHIVRDLDLAQLAALIRRCDLYLGNDSGVTHLASALGVKCVALFGPTDPRRWAPWGRRTTVITQQVECSPCSVQQMKSCAHRQCLTTLVPDRVIKLLEEAVERHPGSGRARLLTVTGNDLYLKEKRASANW